MFCFFWPEACEISAPWPGIEPAPPALDHRLLTAGLPGKSHALVFLNCARRSDLQPGMRTPD